MTVPNGHRITSIENRMSITILYNGKLHVMSDSDAAFAKVCEEIVNNSDYDAAMKYFDKEAHVKDTLEQSVLSDRVRVENGHVYLDGEICDNHITDLIIDMADTGEDYVPLANYFALLSDNPIHHSRHRLDEWLRASGEFSIDKDGYIIGYKGLGSDFKSSRSGPGIVNGYPVNGRLDNRPGNVLQIDNVEMNPEIGCSNGLHVGTFEYARDWAGSEGKLVSVRVSPADIGSVPTDCDSQKMRVFKYEVIEEVSAPYTERIVEW